jgi:hypothetical protein
VRPSAHPTHAARLALAGAALAANAYSAADELMHTFGVRLIDHTGWLYTKLFENFVFFVDLWSFVHAWAGMVLWLLLAQVSPRRRWCTIVAALVSWELLELTFLYFAIGIFKAETLKDQLTDIVIGLLGAALGRGLTRSRALNTVPATSHQGLARHPAVVFAGTTIAFLWVGNYKYHYNAEPLNSAGLNWWAFVLWSLGLATCVEIFLAFRARGRSWSLSLAATWAVYLPALLALEYFGYNVLGIREVGHADAAPLVADLVHGSPALWTFYLLAPGIAVGGFAVAAWSFGRAWVKVGSTSGSMVPGKRE